MEIKPPEKKEPEDQKSKYQKQNERLFAQMKQMKQQIMIRDLALSKVTSASIPMTKLFSEIADNLERES